MDFLKCLSPMAGENEIHVFDFDNTWRGHMVMNGLGCDRNVTVRCLAKSVKIIGLLFLQWISMRQCWHVAMSTSFSCSKQDSIWTRTRDFWTIDSAAAKACFEFSRWLTGVTSVPHLFEYDTEAHPPFDSANIYD